MAAQVNRTRQQNQNRTNTTVQRSNGTKNSVMSTKWIFEIIVAKKRKMAEKGRQTHIKELNSVAES